MDRYSSRSDPVLYLYESGDKPVCKLINASQLHTILFSQHSLRTQTQLFASNGALEFDVTTAQIFCIRYILERNMRVQWNTKSAIYKP